MKCLLILGLVLVAVGVTQAASDDGEFPASVEQALMQQTAAYESFTAASYNASCHRCGCKSCCPVIVRNCPPKKVGSVIQPFSGFRGNAAIIVDWGCTAYNPCGCCSKGGLCTTEDTGFVYGVNWGDGTPTEVGFQKHLGPFQVTHQYPKTCQTQTYGVHVFYCHDPGCPAERCCDTIFRRIDVSEDPSKSPSGVDFAKPLMEQENILEE